MHKIQNFIDFVKNELNINFLEININSLFSASELNHRLNIRHEIVNKYHNQLTEHEISCIKILNLIPRSKKLHFSISHTKKIGGFAVSHDAIGLDLEQSARISKKLIQRVCSDQEIQTAPDFKYLWVAKESILKVASFSMTENLLLSNVKLNGWVKKNDFHLFNGSIDENNNFSGCVFNFDNTFLISVSRKLIN